jgi:hypothetical protein
VQVRLEQLFQQVRSKFFPRWDRTRRWLLRPMTASQARDGDDARCDPVTCTIYFAPKLGRRNRLLTTGILVHEICHALHPRSGHGDPWQRRLMQAAGKAEALGEPELARWLRDEVRGYQTPPGRMTARSTYHEIREFVRESGVLPPFETLVEEFSRSRSISCGEFLKRYPRARKVYESVARRR